MRSLAVALLFAVASAAWADDPTFEITLKDHKFTPQEVSVPSNVKLKLVVKNEDPTPAEFESKKLESRESDSRQEPGDDLRRAAEARRVRVRRRVPRGERDREADREVAEAAPPTSEARSSRLGSALRRCQPRRRAMHARARSGLVRARFGKRGHAMKRLNGALAATALLWNALALAVEPSSVYSPRVEQGEWELEYKAFTVVDRKHDDDGFWNHQVSLGYGVNAFWWTELVGEYEKARHEGGGWEALEWENRFQFTEPGQYWVDTGAIVELEKKRRGNGKEVKLGLLFEKDIDDATVTVNWLAGREYGDDASSKWEQIYRAQLRWRYLPALQPLLELQADEHAMNAGPGLTGKARIAGQKIEYTLAWLLRTSGDTPKNLLRFELELEF